MPISDTLIQTVSSAMKPFPPMIPPTPFLSAPCDSAHGAQSYLRLSESKFLIVCLYLSEDTCESLCGIINCAQIIQRIVRLLFYLKDISYTSSWTEKYVFWTFCSDSHRGENCANHSLIFTFLHKPLMTHFNSLLHNWIGAGNSLCYNACSEKWPTSNFFFFFLKFGRQ